MDYYIEMLRKCIARIEADFEFSAIIDHNASKGTFREQIVQKFLRPFLPNIYGISGGQAFDMKGNISKQLDIVIYDALHSYVAPYMNDFIYFPCESVYGNIEIKSILNKNSFMESLENIASLKALKRDSIDTYYVNPIKELRIKNVTWDIQATNEYFGVIFSYDSVEPETVLGYITKAVKEGFDRNNLPNVIVLFKKRVIISRYRKSNENEYELHPLKDFNGYYMMNYGDDLLPEFLVLLLVMLRCIELKAMDIELLSKKLHDKAFSKHEGIITNILI